LTSDFLPFSICFLHTLLQQWNPSHFVSSICLDGFNTKTIFFTVTKFYYEILEVLLILIQDMMHLQQCIRTWTESNCVILCNYVMF
jgi:hypothetical protein